MPLSIRTILAIALFFSLSCNRGGGNGPADPDDGPAADRAFRSPVMEGPVMIRESMDEHVPDSSAVLHIRSNSDATSGVKQGVEVFFFTGREPHAVAMNIVSQVQPGAVADTIRGMKMTTQNISAAADLVMYGMDVRMRCSGYGASGSTMMPLWVHTEDILGGARDLVSRPIMVTAPTNLEKSFASHVAITAEGPVHVTRGPLRVYKDLDPGEADPDPLAPGSGPGDLVAEGRLIGAEGVVIPALEDDEAKAGVFYFSEKDASLRFRSPDGTLYRVRLEKL